MKIKDWKLFEGYYQDSISKLDSLKKEIIDIEVNYLAEVKDCLWDLIDDFGAEYVPVDEGEDCLSKITDESDPLCVDFEIVVKPDKFEDLLESLVGCNSKCESHIGKSINFEWVGIVTGTGTYRRLNKVSEWVTKSIPFEDKVDYIHKSINIDEFDEAFGLKSICIIITV